MSNIWVVEVPGLRQVIAFREKARAVEFFKTVQNAPGVALFEFTPSSRAAKEAHDKLPEEQARRIKERERQWEMMRLERKK